MTTEPQDRPGCTIWYGPSMTSPILIIIGFTAIQERLDGLDVCCRKTEE